VKPYGHTLLNTFFFGLCLFRGRTPWLERLGHDCSTDQDQQEIRRIHDSNIHRHAPETGGIALTPNAEWVPFQRKEHRNMRLCLVRCTNLRYPAYLPIGV